MKKTSIKLLLLLAVMPIACFCSKNEPNDPQPSGIVTIEASIPQTKVAFTPAADPALTLSWEYTDQIVVEGTTSETFTIDQIASGGHKATFTGNAVAGSSFNVYYPDANVLSRSYEGQVQNGNGSAAHLTYNAMVSGLSSYDKFTFNKVNGAVKLVLNVPSSVTAVSSISITSQDSEGAAQNVFYATNDASGAKTSTLTLGFAEGTTPTEGVLTAYIMVSWNAVQLAADSRLAFSLAVPGRACTYEKVIKLNSVVTVAGGQTFIIDLSSASELEHKIVGSGVEGDPYLLYDVEDLKLMNGLLTAGSTTYFELMADVDMEGVDDWAPANQTEPYEYGINFDGNNHTVSNFTCTASGVYCGFLGVLNGEVANVTFENPVIEATAAAGVVCGYAGSGAYPGKITNVTIINGSVTQTKNGHAGLFFGSNNASGGIYTDCHGTGTVTVASNATPAASKAATGGIAGSVTESTLERCSFIGTINGTRLAGGLIGYIRDDSASTHISECWANAEVKVTSINGVSAEVGGGIVAYMQSGVISNCYSKGTVTVGTQVCGGLVGDVVKPSQITNCWSSDELKAARGAGGIVGRAGTGWNSTGDKCLEIQKCVYWGSKIDVAAAGSGNGSSGSIIGFTTIKNVLSNCWRIADENFTFVNTGNPINKPVDQNDCNGSNWSKSPDADTGEATQIGTGTKPQIYLFPYWGKASSYSTVSATVTGKNLGWDTEIWDLSGDFPKLRNNPEPAPAQ